MGSFFDRARASLQGFMIGRYGVDTLTTALVFAAFVLYLVDMFVGTGVLRVLALALLAYAMFRTLSTNTAARARELDRFERVSSAPRARASLAAKRWKNRKTTRYFTCKKCGTVYSVPKGKGKLRVTCPGCHEQSIHTT